MTPNKILSKFAAFLKTKAVQMSRAPSMFNCKISTIAMAEIAG